MIVRGEIVTKPETASVKVDPVGILRQLHWDWVCNNAPSPQAEYINSDGVWESWDDTGGSGLYRRYGDATEHQKAVDAAFKIVLSEIKK